MIAPGSMVFRVTAKRRTLAYTGIRRRSRSTVARPRVSRDTGGVLLHHHGPYELPSATLHRGTLGGALHRWLDVQWAWLRPRSIPVIVALIGLVGVMAATNYLTNFAHASRVDDSLRVEMRWDHGRLAHVDRATFHE